MNLVLVYITDIQFGLYYRYSNLYEYKFSYYLPTVSKINKNIIFNTSGVRNIWWTTMGDPGLGKRIVWFSNEQSRIHELFSPQTCVFMCT